MLTRVTLGLLLLLFSNNLRAQISADVRHNYKRGSYKGSYNDVVVKKKGREYNLTWFQPWEAIQEVEISPDSNYIFVRHKAQHGKAYKLDMYDLRTLKLIRRITPGAGGDFEWTSLNQVMHRWGCGTNCAPMAVYDLRLNTIFHTLSSGGYIISPAKRYVVQISMHEDEMWVYDLNSLKTGKHPSTYYSAIDSAYKTWYEAEEMRATFTNEHTIRMMRADKTNDWYIDLDKVKWKRTNPDTIQENYYRDK